MSVMQDRQAEVIPWPVPGGWADEACTYCWVLVGLIWVLISRMPSLANLSPLYKHRSRNVISPVKKCNNNCLTCKALDTKPYIRSTSKSTYHNLKIKNTTYMGHAQGYQEYQPELAVRCLLYAVDACHSASRGALTVSPGM